MRCVFELVGVLALSLMLSLGCSEGGGDGGSGGDGGTGGMTGQEFPCTEQGIRDAIAEGGGPHTFACDGPTTVVTQAEIVIDNHVILDGEGNLTVSGDDDHRAFSIPKGITAGLHGFTVTEGNGTYDGVEPYESAGGILNDGTLTLTDSTVSGNTADIGGGVSNDGTLTMTNSTVFGNTAKGGGGISNSGTLTLTNSTVSGNAANVGTGIDNHGTLTLTNSTVSGNTREGDCGRDPPCGGAIWNMSGTLTMTNSTVTGNAFGGLYNILEETAATVMSSTLSNNTGEGSGTLSNILNLQGAALTVRNSLVAGACEIYPAAVSSGHNIESPGDTCGFDQSTDQVNVSAETLKLGPLTNNGGPTQTHALGAGSVAIDAIPEADGVDADGAPLTTDQRGIARPQGGACDVGAFELEVAP